ncbi:Protein strictosidine synthase-like 5 [Vitis vinifera]|uniref:Protein strictosidine synthase-like 5 n=1 Tax=Vitis vinifera TaxID=29760 RepID=A0A438J9A9_VITVI|nr:Protein strictosidine synthase-like 5 [Vitis vinifera]
MAGNNAFGNLNICMRTSSTVILACILASALQIFLFSPISPDLLQLPQPSSAALLTNKKLQEVAKIGEGLLDKPEDVLMERAYCIQPQEMGVTPTRTGGIIVCDIEKGLLKVGEDGVSVLTSHVNGSKINVASTEFVNWYLDVLEAKPHGQLLKYDPLLNETSILLDNLAFANGVALSQDEDFLVVCETWKCLKYWLEGERKGRTETFIDNLPGGPDNINLAPDGSFWIALIKVTSDGFEFVHTSKALKHLLATFPKLFQLVKGSHKKASVVKVAADGKIIDKFDDPNGKVISFVTSALEFEDYLYLGSLNTNFIGILPLKAA